MGGTPKRMENFANYIMKEIGHKLPAGTTLLDITKNSYRYSMYKVGPVLSISVSLSYLDCFLGAKRDSFPSTTIICRLIIVERTRSSSSVPFKAPRTALPWLERGMWITYWKFYVRSFKQIYLYVIESYLFKCGINETRSRYAWKLLSFHSG